MDVRNLTLGATLGVCLALPVVAQEPAAATPGADTVVATVGGTDITLGHMIALRERLPAQYQQLPDEALFEGVLTQLINQEALSRQADATAARTELVLENERRALLANAVLQEAAEAAVTEEAIAAAYEETYVTPGPKAEWNAAHILLATEDEARAVKGELDGGADFAGLAREKSTDPAGANGGALGWFGPGMMVPEFEQAISALEPGQVSEPFQTQFGWHVALLNEDREQTAPPLEEVRGEITAQIQQQTLEAMVAGATEGIEVVRPDISDINPSVLSDLSLID